jgi:hypothetical protein
MIFVKVGPLGSTLKSPGSNHCLPRQRNTQAGKNGDPSTRLRPINAVSDLDWVAPAAWGAVTNSVPIALVLFGFNQSKQLGKIEAQQAELKDGLAKQEEAFNKRMDRQEEAFNKRMDKIETVIERGFSAVKAELETVKVDLGELKSDKTYLQGFKAGKEEESRTQILRSTR